MSNQNKNSKPKDKTNMLTQSLKLAVLTLTAFSGYMIQQQSTPGAKLKFTAFNIQIFGVTKMDKPEVVDILMKILSRYDLIQVEEIRDASETAFPDLVQDLNDYTLKSYKYEVGPRVGRSSSKEQYGFIYDSAKMSVNQTWQYPDITNIFERPPYVVQFKLDAMQDPKYVSFIPSHTKPDDTINEMNGLVHVYDAWHEISKDNNVIIMGDLNADCSYVCKSCWDKVELKNDDRFNWWIPTGMDTTSHKSNDCTYDRVITTGSWLSKHTCCAVAFDYQEEYGLDDELTLEVSDHYPVEFVLN